MPYCVIGGEPVFLSRSRHDALRNEVLKAKDARHRISSMIAGTEESKERSELIYAALEAKYRANPGLFRREWVEFDLVGDEARENVWDLLYDYCDFHGYAYLSDLRDEFSRIKADYIGDAYQYPMGRIFALDHPVAPARWWWRYTARMRGRTVRLVIIAGTVERLVGTLVSFLIVMPGSRIRCGQDLEILPLRS